MHTQSQSALLSIIVGDSPLLKVLQETDVIQMFSSLFGLWICTENDKCSSVVFIPQQILGQNLAAFNVFLSLMFFFYLLVPPLIPLCWEVHPMARPLLCSLNCSLIHAKVVNKIASMVEIRKSMNVSPTWLCIGCQITKFLYSPLFSFIKYIS